MSVYTVTTVNTSGEGSLAWAIAQVNASSGLCIIEFASDLVGQAIPLSTSIAITNSAVSIRGLEDLTIDIATQAFALKGNVLVQTAEAPLRFISTLGSTDITLGLAGKTLSFQNIELRTTGAHGEIYIANPVSMTGCGLYGSDVYVNSTFTGSNVEITADHTSHQDVIQVGASGRLTLKNSQVNMKKGSLEVKSGGKATFTGGSLAVSYTSYVREGASLSLDGTYLKLAGVTLTNEGALTLKNLEVAPTTVLNCKGGDTLTAKHVSFGAGTTIKVSSSSTVRMEDCMFKVGTEKTLLQITRGEDADVKLTGCNLSNVSVVLKGEPSDDLIDLSGNYWGEGYDSLEKIISLIEGYNSTSVVINNWLSEDPSAPDLALNTPSLTSAAKGTVKFSWDGETGCTYELTVDGKVVYTGTGTSYSMEIAGGDHTYTVTSIDALANRRVRSDSFTYNATAGKIAAEKPVPVFSVFSTSASGEGSLAWAIEQANLYKKACRIEFSETLVGQALPVDTSLAIINPNVVVSPVETLTLKTTQIFAVQSDIHAEAEPLTFLTSAGNSDVTLGSSIVDTTITLDNVEFRSTGAHGEVYIAKPVIMNGGGIYGSDIYVKSTFTGTRVELSSDHTSHVDYIQVEADGHLMLEDSLVNMKKGGMTLKSGSQATITGGSLLLSGTLSVATEAVLELNGTYLSPGTSNFDMSSSGTVRMESLELGTGYAMTSLNDGVLEASNVIFGAGTQLVLSANTRASLENCHFRSGSTASTLKITGGGSGTLTVKGCDLSNVSVVLSGEAGNSLIDLSGNYWGTTDMEVIKSKITGYDANYIFIGSVLSSAPSMPQIAGPALSLEPVETSVVGTGKTNVTFNWEGGLGCTYTLMVDGQRRYSGSATTYTLALDDGSHTYSVTATGTAGNTSTESGSLVTDATAPAKPSGLKAGVTQQGKQAVLSWTAVTDMSGVTYELAYKTSSAADFTTLSGLTTSSKTISLPSTAYYNWKVRAVDGKGNATSWVWGSSFNNTVVSADTTPPTTPTNLKFGLTQQGKQVVLSWAASTDPSGVTYELAYKAATASDFTTLSGLTYTAKTIDLPLTGYYNWKIRAVDGKGNATSWVWGSSFNNKTATSTDTTPPTTPTNLKFGLTQQGKQAVLSWTASTDASGVTYELAYKAATSASFTTLTGLTYPAKTIDLPLTGYYNWKLRAKDGAGNYTSWVWGSSFSNITSGGSPSTGSDTTPPTTPTNLKFGLTQGGKQAVLSWTASTDASGVTYELAYKAATSASFTTLTGLTYPAKTIDLPLTGYYNWKLRAKDGAGNYTSWVWGSSFNNLAGSVSSPSTSPASVSALSLDKELSVSAGASYLDVDASSVAAPLATCGLSLERDAAKNTLAQSMLA